MPIDQIKRREFITLLGGAAASWPLAAHAQQGERVRRIGVFAALPADDAEWQARLAAFHQGLQELGWSVGRNVRIDYRLGSGDGEQLRQRAAELVALAPDVILATGTPVMGALQQVTRTVPIVFTVVPDPVGAGYVESLSRPGGNATGFMTFEVGFSAKWLELLKELKPAVTRVGVLRDPAITAGIGQWSAIQAVTPSFGVELTPIDMREASEIERGITTFARGSSDGLIITGSALATVHRDLIVALAAKHKMPAVYPFPYFAKDGGLLSYGPDLIDQYRRAAGHVDRILKGEKPAELPVQAPTKYDLIINLKAAKVVGVSVPPTLLARADEVIE
jgi:ABC-type uncharacterized transport system substrate-binding protein